MVAEAGMKLTVLTLLLTERKFSDGGWSWNEADSLDALGLIECKCSDNSNRSCNDADNLDIFMTSLP